MILVMPVVVPAAAQEEVPDQAEAIVGIQREGAEVVLQISSGAELPRYMIAIL